MALDVLTEIDIPTITRRIVAEKVAEYVEVTGDDPDRWSEAAPPSYAGALLFMATPQLLGRPEVVPYTTVLVHLDQMFRWHAPILLDQEVAIAGRVERVRSRGGVWFVTFAMAVTSGADTVIESTSTFLLGGEPAGEVAPARIEPPVQVRASSEHPVRYDPDSGVPDLAKSASRGDLVRYAAASGDFNPIHFDHDAARGAGLSGIVSHGLLTTAWVTQLASAATDHRHPLAELAVRYRDPVYPADAVTIGGVARPSEGGLRRIDVTVTAEDRTAITGRVMVWEA